MGRNGNVIKTWRQHKAAIILVAIGCFAYGGHMLYRYWKIRGDSDRRASFVVRPRLSDNDIAEFGYIYEMRDEMFLRDDNRVNLVWFVKIPSTGARYSCQYEEGFPGFHRGDDVRLIRPNDVSSDAGYGYLIGLHESTTGKAASVWVNDEEQLELDTEPPEPPDPE